MRRVRTCWRVVHVWVSDTGGGGEDSGSGVGARVSEKRFVRRERRFDSAVCWVAASEETIGPMEEGRAEVERRERMGSMVEGGCSLRRVRRMKSRGMEDQNCVRGVGEGDATQEVARW